MRFDLIALYAGPDQIMTVTSGLASILGVLLIFWHKVTGFFGRLIRKLRRSPQSAPETHKENSRPQS